jgi:hypothetical protein
LKYSPFCKIETRKNAMHKISLIKSTHPPSLQVGYIITFHI